jgi:hypothetical protein
MAGDIIVHRDDNHLSAAYVRSRADAFAAALARAGADLTDRPRASRRVR